MRTTALGLLLLAAAACTTPLELGERRYREGDRLKALEIWRGIPADHPLHDAARERIDAVEREFRQLVLRFRQRGRYFEERGRLAESILNYRLALELKPGDRETLEHVQRLARVLARHRTRAREAFSRAFEQGDLASARRHLEALRNLDPFDTALALDERRFEEAVAAEVEERIARGRRAFEAGRLARAERIFREVLELDPTSQPARGYLSYVRSLRAAAAEGQDGRAHPTDAEVEAEGFYQAARAAEERGEPYRALELHLRALELDPGHEGARERLESLRARLRPRVEALVAAGMEAYREEDLQTARDQWRRAVLVDPEHPRARAYLARAERLIEGLEQLRSEPDRDVAAP